MTKIKIKIPEGFATIDPKLVTPHPKNIKKHPEEQILAIVEAIKMLKVFKDPLGLDTKNKNLCYFGNGKLLAALKLQEEGLLDVVPYIPLDHLSPKDRKALMLIDNKLADMAVYDKDNIVALMSEIGGFDFEPFHMDFAEYSDHTITQDEVPALRKTSILPGELYQLGAHRLLCGDALLPTNVAKLFSGKHADSIVTDPPYGVEYSTKNEFLNLWDHGNRIQEPIKNDDIKDYQKFTEEWLKWAPLESYNTIYIFQAGINYHKTRMGIEAQGITWGADLIWKKHHFVFGRKDYKFQHEPILYGWKGRHKFYGPSNRTTILEYDRPTVSEMHPTTKPVELLAQLIQDGSREHHIIYDPFAGSGSTLVACQQTDRISYNIEIEPAYCQVIIDRWEKITGLTAKKLEV